MASRQYPGFYTLRSVLVLPERRAGERVEQHHGRVNGYMATCFTRIKAIVHEMEAAERRAARAERRKAQVLVVRQNKGGRALHVSTLHRVVRQLRGEAAQVDGAAEEALQAEAAQRAGTGTSSGAGVATSETQSGAGGTGGRAAERRAEEAMPESASRAGTARAAAQGGGAGTSSGAVGAASETQSSAEGAGGLAAESGTQDRPTEDVPGAMAAGQGADDAAGAAAQAGAAEQGRAGVNGHDDITNNELQSADRPPQASCPGAGQTVNDHALVREVLQGRLAFIWRQHDSYISATKMCQSAGREWRDFRELTKFAKAVKRTARE